MLPHNSAVTAVAQGEGGLCDAASGAKVWIDFSSIDKKTIWRLTLFWRRRAGRCSTLLLAA